MFVTTPAIGRLVARPRLCSVSGLTSSATFHRAVKQRLIMHYQQDLGAILLCRRPCGRSMQHRSSSSRRRAADKVGETGKEFELPLEDRSNKSKKVALIQPLILR
jgi:hypothetical protein